MPGPPPGLRGPTTTYNDGAFAAWFIGGAVTVLVLLRAAAAARADILFLLTPDEVMTEVYEKEVAPHLVEGNLLNFAHGYNVGFDLIVPPPNVDVVLIAPRMIGAGVRESYLDRKSVV